jgi:hypothetical protein
MNSKQKTQRGLSRPPAKTQQGMIKKGVYFTASATLDLDDFLASHPFKAYSIYHWNEILDFAPHLNKDLNTSVKDFISDREAISPISHLWWDRDKGSGITNVTLCCSFTGAQVYINNLIPENERNDSLVREKVLPKVERERHLESVYQKIEKLSDPRDLLEDEQIMRLIRKDPARVYTYFQICNNNF